jgi:hypothetical protein
MTEFIVYASRDPDGRDPRQIGMTPSYAEALEWLEQVRMDGWATAWIEQAPMD